MIRKIIIITLIILSAASIYLGSYLSVAKGRKYIQALSLAKSANSFEDIKNVFDGVLDFKAPVSDEEIVKFISADIVSIVSFEGQPELPSRQIAAYIEERINQDNVLHLINIAFTYKALWEKFHNEDYFTKTEGYFLKIIGMAPKLPQPLHGLFVIYGQHGDTEKMIETGNAILELWPEEESIRQTMENAQQPPQL